MNRIRLGGLFEFTDENFIGNPELFLSESMLADSLGIDTVEFEITSQANGEVRYVITADNEIYQTRSAQNYVVDEGDLLALPYGTGITVYKNNTQIRRFYLEKITQTAPNKFKVNGISDIGLLDKIQHNGGMYDGETVGDILPSLLGSIDYSVSEEVASVPVYGWLPRASARDNLRSLLFSCGASILHSIVGGNYICFNTGWQIGNIFSESDLYMTDGHTAQPDRVSKIILTEHQFIEADNPEEILFDNTGEPSVSSQTIFFDYPYHSFRAEGLTINDSDVNWATITGAGVLYGKKYTDTMRELSQSLNGNVKPNEIYVKDAYLVNALNSYTTLQRLTNFYANARYNELDIATVNHTKLLPGSAVIFTDPITKSQKQGLLQKNNMTLSATDKNQLNIVTDWVPSHFGNGYTHYAVITGAAYWYIPAGTESLRIIAIGAGQGGSSGANGTSRADGTVMGGYGGAGGETGSPGKVAIVDYTVPPNVSRIGIWCGTGGAGGEQTSSASGASSVAGEYGGYTEVTQTSMGGAVIVNSDSGSVIENGFVNTFTGEAFAINGMDGISGGDGTSYYPSIPQTTVEYEGQTWYSGAEGNPGEDRSPAGGLYAYGGKGGGPAVGANGNNGLDGDDRYSTGTDEHGKTFYVLDGGNGGAGADATIPGTDQTVYGAGGNGGHGGGGGGGGGYGDQNGEGYDSFSINGYCGAGGKGSAGGKGGNGCVIIYY